MKSVSRWGASALVAGLAVVLATTFFAAAVGAQPTAPAPKWSCGDTVTVRSYAECPLKLERHALLRGDDWRIIARGGTYRPMPLSVVVSGDSARHYALRYEHDARVAGRSLGILQPLLLATIAVSRSYHCGEHTISGCANSATPYLIATSAMAASSVVLTVIHYAYREREWQWAAKAVWWHNKGVAELR